MKLETFTRSYERMLMLGAALTPTVAIGYLMIFSATPPLRFEDHAFHEIAIAIAIAVGGFVSFVSWCSYRASGEIFLRWLTVGFIAFTLIYAPHGVLTRTAHHNIWLFLLYGPVSRFVMLACLVFGLAQYGKSRENPLAVTQSGFWRRVLWFCVVVNVAVATLAYSPIASSPWVRMSLESGAVILCALGLAMMAWRRIKSPLMIFYAFGLVLFAQAAIAFMLAKPWNHLWWLAHAIFAGGFFVLSWGVARALLTTRSFALAYSQEQLMRSLEREKELTEVANRELLLSQGRLQAVLDSVEDCVITIDSFGIIRSFNRSAEKVFAYSSDEVIGRNVNILMPDASSSAHDNYLEQMRKTGAKSFIGKVRQLEAKRKDGAIFPIELTLAETKVGDEILFTGSLRDITERKNAEAELLQYRNHLEELVFSRTAELAASRDAAEAANRAKSIFLANMSHELRTPMNGIMGMTELALHRATDIKQIDWLNKSQEAAKRLLRLINDVLDISSIEAEQLLLEEQDFSVVQVIEEVLNMHEPSSQAKGLSLISQMEEGLPPLLRGDALRFKQILVNFMSNSIKFSEQGLITLRALTVEQDNHSVLLRVEVVDQGIGIDQEEQAKLFHAFSQGDGSITRKFGGTGLGLYISRRIALLMGGDAGVISEAGKGSTFWATLRLRRGEVS